MTYEEVLWQFRIDPKRQDPEKLIDANLALVFSIASKFHAKHKSMSDKQIDFVDLFQAGIIGLNQAIQKYDSTKEMQFSTYAYPWIAQRVREEVRRSIYPLRTYSYVSVNITEFEDYMGRTDNSAMDTINYNELIAYIRKLLKPKEFKLFCYYFVEGRKLSEIAIMMGRCVSTIQYHLRNLKDKLQNELSELRAAS